MPSRSMRVSMLSRLSRMGVVFVLGPGLDLADRLAWSLCCQQYKSGSAGSSTRSFFREALRAEAGDADGDAESGRLHGRPLDVMPLHVVSGFLESERPNRASGVLGINGICALGRVVTFGRCVLACYVCISKLVCNQRLEPSYAQRKRARQLQLKKKNSLTGRSIYRKEGKVRGPPFTRVTLTMPTSRTPHPQA
ncbi:hypothetical protein BX600DRAFT_464561 [Xylariales sp. PMI_506]|nr:hypothetical protein BX600DRAFT_464561 [Xylariales sp. PMI_506]